MGFKKILITGEAGRGKTTLAKELSKKLNIKHIETDNFYWKRRFDIPRNKEESIKLLKKEILKHKNWIVEGTTRHLISQTISKADLIIYMNHKTLLNQYIILTKRYKERKGKETFLNYLGQLKHTFRRRYNIGTAKKTPFKELLKDYKNKTITITSFKQKNKFLKSIY